jgi:hypothetical protein
VGRDTVQSSAMKMEAISASETLVVSARLHGVTSQKGYYAQCLEDLSSNMFVPPVTSLGLN